MTAAGSAIRRWVSANHPSRCLLCRCRWWHVSPLVRQAAGFDRDHVSAGHADPQGGAQSVDDVDRLHVPVQQEHLDELAGAVAVAVGLAGG